MPLVVGLLKHKYSTIRVAAIRAVIEFFKQCNHLVYQCTRSDCSSAAELLEAIEAATPLLPYLLKDKDYGVREAAIANFSKQRKIALFVRVHFLILNLQQNSSKPSRLSYPIYSRTGILVFVRPLYSQSPNCPSIVGLLYCSSVYPS